MQLHQPARRAVALGVLASVRLVIAVNVADSSYVDANSSAHAHVCLPAEAGSVARARAFTRERLARWQFRGDHEDVILVVSELVTNAILHSRGPAVLRLAGTAWQVRIEVADESQVFPAVRQAGADGGWGLRLIERVTAEWGVAHRDGGKVVWCTMQARLAPVESQRGDTVA